MSDTYPPPGHFLRYLGITQDGPTSCLPARPDLCAGGAVGLGPITAMVDVLAGWVVMDAITPDWGATLDLIIHTDGPFTDDVVGEASVLRAGGRTVVVEVALRSGDRGGISTITYSRLERRDMNPSASPVLPSRAEPVDDLSGVASSVGDFLQLASSGGAGELRLERIEPVQNSIGAYNGGAIASLADASACAFAADRAGVDPDAVTGIDMTLNYLSAARTGPIVSRPETVSLRNDGATIRVSLHDEGSEGRTAAVITQTVRW